MVIALTILLLGLLLAVMIAGAYWMANQMDKNALQTYNGLGTMGFSLAWILTQVFLVVLVIIAIYMAVMAVKAWIEKYLDAMLAEQKAEREAMAATMGALNEKFARVEQKLDHIGTILEKVGE
jgi:small-conductance mechanosensitive channel